MSETIACSACGAENRVGARFCDECGARLGILAASEERKVVTTLICDLVGFTAMTEAADAEDVDCLLGEYFSRATKAIESHGGTVEKFIGDAVVGVFGVPAVHEDDPERAVRASLRLIEALESMTRPDGSPLEVRCGVNTGEAFVRIDVDPSSGRGFLTGDAVNVAARLQAAAPPGAVVVGALTHDLTERDIVYEELPPVAAKGKAEPVSAWLATGRAARLGVDDRGELTPLVGRDMELVYLSAIFEKAAAQADPQVVLIVGEPGIGKSRMVRELFAVIDARPEMIIWRQGHCPPFGEDVTYWALADIVKSHAGIRDTDESAVVAAKLDAVLPPGPDREWFGQRLRAVIGLPAPDAAREQSFAAWLRFFEGIAAADPTVLVFEDLHWADDALLDFLEYLTNRLADVPLLLVCTARPELFERRPSFAAGSTMTRVGLGPLSPGETTRLVAGLLGESAERARVVGEVVERCGGNPFYAEQSARLLVDTDLTAQLPDSVQAVIAARLDALPAEEKALLADAAVVGSVFWAGALAALGGRDDADVEDGLAQLLEHRLVRRVRESSMEGEHEYMFAHTLAREVGYGQLPRAVRARRHVSVAAWLEQATGERAPDFAEVLAYHLTTAHTLAGELQDAGLAAELRGPAMKWLRAAGDRAQSVDVATARRHYERALEIAPEADPVRANLLLGLGEMLLLAGDYEAAMATLEQAVELFSAQGETGGAVRAMLRLDYVLARTGKARPGLVDQALALARSRPASRELVDALEAWAWDEYNKTGDARPSLAAVEEALAICDEHGFSPVVLFAARGGLRVALGDAGGLADERRALELAEKAQQEFGFQLANCMCNYVIFVSWVEGAKASEQTLSDCIDFLDRRGMVADASYMRNLSFEFRLDTGDWATLAEDLAAAEHQLGEDLEIQNQRTLKTVQLLHGARVGRTEGFDEALAILAARRPASPFAWEAAYDLVPSAVGLAALGRPEEAVRMLEDWAAMPEALSTVEYACMVPEAVRAALRLWGVDLAERLRHRGDGLLPVQQHVMASANALLAEAHDEHEEAAAGFAAAASRWHDFGVPYEEGHALLGQGRCLAALGRAPEAAAPLAAARELFARLGAAPALAETDEWLAKAGEHEAGSASRPSGGTTVGST